jgi:hypothetical protein
MRAKLFLALPAFMAGALIFGANPAKAALCGSITTIGDLALEPGASCTLTSGWTFTYNPTTTLPLTTFFTFSGSAASTTLSFQADPVNFTTAGQLTYDFSLSAPVSRHLTSYSSSITSSVSAADDGSWGITSAATGQQALGTYSSPNGVTSTKTYSNTTTLSDSFTGVFALKSGEFTQFTSSFTSALNPPPPSGVPGPVPVLGAGAAFAFSRRLRRRISAV